jgi:hypothetical protein
MATASTAAAPAIVGSAPMLTCKVVNHDVLLEQSPSLASRMLKFGLLREKVGGQFSCGACVDLGVTWELVVKQICPGLCQGVCKGDWTWWTWGSRDCQICGDHCCCGGSGDRSHHGLQHCCKCIGNGLSICHDGFLMSCLCCL